VHPKESITALAFDAYKKALPLNYHNELRITGQSLGAQVAIQLTDRILHDPLIAQPTRLALMDPYFGVNGLYTVQNNLPYSVADYNVNTVNDIEAIYAKRHKNQTFPIAVYRTSIVSMAPTGNPNWNLMDKVAYTRLYPVYIKDANSADKLVQQHKASTFLYFSSMAFTPVNSSDPNAQHIDARATDAQVVSMMQQKRYQVIDVIDKTAFQVMWLSKFTNKQPLNPDRR
jgi:hypothetical protein